VSELLAGDGDHGVEVLLVEGDHVVGDLALQQVLVVGNALHFALEDDHVELLLFVVEDVQLGQHVDEAPADVLGDVLEGVVLPQFEEVLHVLAFLVEGDELGLNRVDELLQFVQLSLGAVSQDVLDHDQVCLQDGGLLLVQLEAVFEVALLVVAVYVVTLELAHKFLLGLDHLLLQLGHQPLPVLEHGSLRVEVHLFGLLELVFELVEV